MLFSAKVRNGSDICASRVRSSNGAAALKYVPRAFLVAALGAVLRCVLCAFSAADLPLVMVLPLTGYAGKEPRRGRRGFFLPLGGGEELPSAGVVINAVHNQRQALLCIAQQS